MRFRSSKKGEHIFFLLEQNALTAGKAGRLLQGLMEHTEGIEGQVEEIAALERFGDEVVQQTAVALQRAKHAPLDRRDIAALTDALDGIVDGAGSVAASMLAYGLDAPSERARGMAEAIAQSCGELQKSVGLLKAGTERHSELLALTASVRARAAAMERANGGLLAEHFAAGQDAETILKWRDVYGDLRRALGETRSAAVALEGAVMGRGRGLLRRSRGLRAHGAH